MKTLLALVAIILAGIAPVACKASPPTFADYGHIITVSPGQDFVLALGSNPTTGYSWETSYDETVLRLVSRHYEQSDQSGGRVGVGGIDFFRFEAVKSGKTSITVSYKRSWEPQVIEQKTFTVDVR